MRVLLTSGTFQESADGVARTMLRFSATLAKRQIHHMVFAPTLDDVRNPYLTTFRVPSVALPHYPQYRAAWPTRAVKKAFAEFKPDIVHIATPDFLGKAALKFAHKHKLPVVSAYHTHFPSYLRYYKVGFAEPWLWKKLRKFYAGCDEVLAPTEEMRRLLGEQGIERVSLWQRGIEASLFNPDRRDLELRSTWGDESDFIVCFAGRLVWYKGVDVVRQLYRQFAHPDRIQSTGMRTQRRVRFVMIGDGPAGPELRKSMPTATFLGHVQKEDVGKMMATSDLLLFPSDTETFGQVVMEGFACGLPAVVCDKGGPCELVTQAQAGAVAQAGSVSEFTGAVARIVNHPDQYEAMRQRAIAYTQDRDWDRINDGVVATYKRLLARSSSIGNS